jgi:hypothetical protein
MEIGDTAAETDRPERELTVKIELHKVTPYKILWTGEKKFTYKGQEETFLRFTLDKDGNLILPFRFEEIQFVTPTLGSNIVPVGTYNAYSEEDDNNDDEVRDAMKGF